MNVKKLFKYLLAGVLLVGGTVEAMAQTAKWTRGTKQGTDIWFWFRYENATGTVGGVTGNDAIVTPNSMTDIESDGAGWSKQDLYDYEGKVISLKTGSGKDFRTVVEKLSLTITVPAKTKVNYTYEMETYISVSNGSSAAACELLYWGEEDKTVSYTYNTSDNNSASGTETICKAFVNKGGNNTESKIVTFDCDNSAGTSEKTYTYYFAVLAYVRYNDSENKTAEAYVKPILLNQYKTVLDFRKEQNSSTTISKLNVNLNNITDTKGNVYSKLPEESTYYPIKEGMTFDGWYTDNGTMVFDAAGNPVEGTYWIMDSKNVPYWRYSNGELRLYPHWITEVAVIDVNIIRDNNDEGTDGKHRYLGITVGGMNSVSDFTGSGYITVDGTNYLSAEMSGSENIKSVSLENAPVWNFEETGSTDVFGNKTYNIYTVLSDGTIKYLGNKVTNPNTTPETVEPSALALQDKEPALKCTIYNDKGWICIGVTDPSQKYPHILYMKNDGNWEWENSNNNTQYKPIKLVSTSSASYGTISSAKIISVIKAKILSSDGNGNYPYAYNVGTTPTINDKDLCKGLLYVDMSRVSQVIDSSDDLKNFQSITADNCLFFVPNNMANSLNNMVKKNADGTTYATLNSVVLTDKQPYSSPYDFTGSLKYTRENTDGELIWTTMCLPFEVQNNNDNIKYYELYASDDVHMAFKRTTSNIPANHPIVCSIKANASIMYDYSTSFSKDVDQSYANTNVANYSDETDKTTSSWTITGERIATCFYGNTDLVYYISNNQMRYVNPNGRVKVLPMRAYFSSDGIAEAKPIKMIVLDDENGTLDITDIINGNNEVGDGKIYDLCGRRVMIPVKGSLYIVNGKKTVY